MISPQECCQRGASSEKWKRGELQKRFSVKAFPQNLTANKVALTEEEGKKNNRHLGFNQILSNARLPLKPMVTKAG